MSEKVPKRVPIFLIKYREQLRKEEEERKEAKKQAIFDRRQRTALKLATKPTHFKYRNKVKSAAKRFNQREKKRERKNYEEKLRVFYKSLEKPEGVFEYLGPFGSIPAANVTPETSSNLFKYHHLKSFWQLEDFYQHITATALAKKAAEAHFLNGQ